MKIKWNSRLVGLVVGLLAPMIILYGINVYSFPSIDFGTFLANSWNFRTLSTWLKMSLLFNLVFFMLFMNLNYLRTGQGIVFATLFYGMLIVYLTFA